MESSYAHALSNEELMSLAYNEGTLSAEEREHLEHCSICQQRLATYTNTNARLLSKLYRSLCPSAVQLNYYCLGIVPEEQRISIASHLLDCLLCADEVAEIRKLQAAFDPFPPDAFSFRRAIRRIFATLVVQQAQPVLRDDRPETAGWPRQYRAESIDLSLHLSHASDGKALLLGIVTSSDPTKTLDAFEGMKVDLYSAAGPLAKESTSDQEQEETIQPTLSTVIDDVGNIFLEAVPAGEYAMIVRLPDQEVVIEGLNINS